MLRSAPRIITILFLTFLACTGCESGKGSSNSTSTPAGTPTALSWSAPSHYSDGAAIAPGDIVAYKIYSSTTSGVYSSATTSLVLASTTTATINDIVSNATGTFYFVVTAIDKNGNESDFSNEMVKQILPLP